MAKDTSSGLWKRHAFSLRFESQTVESAFIQGRKDQMVTNLSRLAWLQLFSCGTAAVPQLMEWPSSTTERKVNTVGECAAVLIALAFVLCPRIPLVQRQVSFRGWEAVCVALLLFLVVHTAHLDDTLFKDDSMDLYERLWHCARVALGLDAYVTVTHLCLPFRWYIMVWVDVFTMASFSAYSLIMIGDALSSYTIRINILFLVFVAGASLGLRFKEINERLLFVAIAKERRLRCEAEFTVETQKHRAQGSAGARSPPQPDDGVSLATQRSVPETTATGDIFLQASRSPEASSDLVSLGLRERWFIRQEELDLSNSRLLGRGGQGEVFSGTFCRGPVAVKQVTAGGQVGGGRAIYNELRILRHVRHPHIALFHGASVGNESGKILIVMERIEGKPLDAVISHMQLWKQDSSRHHLPKQMYMMQRVCQALVYLHAQSPCIVHGDLKPSNILVERRGSHLWPKLLDFGLSHAVSRNSQVKGGTPAYIAPEIVLRPNERPHPSMDHFSFGRLLYFVACGRSPSGNLSTEAIMQLIANGTPVMLAWLPSTSLLRRWRSLIEACTAMEASERPSAEQAYDTLVALERAAGAAPQESTSRQSFSSSSQASAFGSLGHTSVSFESVPESPEESIREPKDVLLEL